MSGVELDWLLGKPEQEEVKEIPPSLPKDTPIIVDSREPKDAIALLNELKVPVVVQELLDGDYVIADWYFSRKTITDFFSSRNSGHLDDEIDRLIKSYDNICLIVEKNLYNTRDEMTVAHKAMDTLKFLMPVIYTQSLRDTAETLVHYREKILKHELNYRKRKVVIVGHPNPVIQLYASLPGVGSERARRIYDKYPVPFDLIKDIGETATFDKAKWKTKSVWKNNRWTVGIEGVGDKTADAVAELLLNGEWITED